MDSLDVLDASSFSPIKELVDDRVAISTSAIIIESPLEVARIHRRIGLDVVGWPGMVDAGASIVLSLAAFVSPFVDATRPMKRAKSDQDPISFGVLSTECVCEVTIDGFSWKPVAQGVVMFTPEKSKDVLNNVLKSGSWKRPVASPASDFDSNAEADARTRVVAMLFHNDVHNENIPGHKPTKWNWTGSCSRCPLGTPITVVGSPYCLFDPDVFFGSLSTGTVANQICNRKLDISDNSGLTLINAPCHPGMAGAPVIASNVPNGEAVIGMVLAPLVRIDGLVVELSFVLPWSSIKESLMLRERRPQTLLGFRSDMRVLATPAVDSSQRNILQKTTSPLFDLVEYWSAATVLIRASDHWGTGVILDWELGLVLTNAHLINSSKSVRIRYNHSFWSVADVVYVASPFPDIAVLKLRRLDNSLRPHYTIPAGRCSGDDLLKSDGCQIMILGYPSLPPDCTPTPTISFGKMVTRVAKNLRTNPSQIVSLIMTTATVHPGSSGGPVVRVSDGALVGILTSFSQCCDDAGILISAHPRLNFVVPVSLIDPVWKFPSHKSISRLNAEFDGLRRRKIMKFWMQETPTGEPSLDSTKIASKL